MESYKNLFRRTNSTERLRITSGGDVGIGDKKPNGNYGTNLSVHSTATDGARLKLSDGTTGKGNTDGFDLISTGGVAYILNRENADMSFSTNNTERLRITSDGKIVTSGGAAVGTVTLAGDGKDMVFGRTQNSGTGGVGRLVATGNLVYILLVECIFRFFCSFNFL